jgi:predicted amidophosphoribosyltransferase
VLLDLLLPRRCVVCARGGAQLCAPCRDALPGLTPPLCELCGAPTAWPVARCRECSGRRLAFASARAAVPYDDDVRRLVRMWKERGLRHLDDAFADVVAGRLARPDADVVTFVPPDAWRSRQRGHRPAERLARALAERWGMACEPLLDRAAGAGRRQSSLTRRERLRNPAFRATDTGGRIVLVDDVYTTGATVHAAARALQATVDVVTLARTVRRA